MATEHDVSGRVLALCVGMVRPLESRGRIHRTAIVKRPVIGSASVGLLGVAGDEHQYPDHGGADQALLAYSADHYPFWRDQFGIDLPPGGAFGENLTLVGLDEDSVCIGDTLLIGAVVAQITSPRSPCYKIGARYHRRDLPVVMQQTLRPGYLLRVLVEGRLQAGLEVELVDRPADTMTVAEAARVVNRDRDDWPAVDRLVRIPELAAALREKLRARLDGRDRGSDEERLFGEEEGDPVGEERRS